MVDLKYVYFHGPDDDDDDCDCGEDDCPICGH